MENSFPIAQFRHLNINIYTLVSIVVVVIVSIHSFYDVHFPTILTESIGFEFIRIKFHFTFESFACRFRCNNIKKDERSYDYYLFFHLEKWTVAKAGASRAIWIENNTNIHKERCNFLQLFFSPFLCCFGFFLFAFSCYCWHWIRYMAVTEKRRNFRNTELGNSLHAQQNAPVCSASTENRLQFLWSSLFHLFRLFLIKRMFYKLFFAKTRFYLVPNLFLSDWISRGFFFSSLRSFYIFWLNRDYLWTWLTEYRFLLSYVFFFFLRDILPTARRKILLLHEISFRYISFVFLLRCNAI